MIIFSPRVKDVIAYSKEEALRLGHNFIGTEHLMLGILRDGDGKAIAILNSIEVNLEELRRKVEILNPAALENEQGMHEKKKLASYSASRKSPKNNIFRS
jgi:ATP-dependent Clp protease ATP-binding subunit ClpC